MHASTGRSMIALVGFNITSQLSLDQVETRPVDSISTC